MSWLRRSFRQNVQGFSPDAPYTIWADLQAAIQWNENAPGGKEAAGDRVKEDFKDETVLLGYAFTKLIGAATVLALVFALGQVLGTRIDMAAAGVIGIISLIMAVWALSARFKVFGKTKDAGFDALRVDDGTGSMIKTPLEANAWHWYKWLWHRRNTRIAIERMFLLVCLLIIVTLGATFIQLVS